MTEAQFVTDVIHTDVLGELWRPRRTECVAVRELPTMHGVPDLVLMEVDGRALRERVAAGLGEPVCDDRSLSVLLAMRRNTRTSIARLAEKLGWNSDRRVERIVNQLSSAGYVYQSSPGVYVRRAAFQPVANRLVAIEAKLHDWKRALYQAGRYRVFAHATFVLLPCRFSRGATAHADDFRRAGVGLAVHDDAGVDVVVPSPTRQPVSRFAHAKCAERALAFLPQSYEVT